MSVSSVSSVCQSCPALCDRMDCSTPGLPVHHQLPELTQTHVHWVDDASQPSHLLLSPFPPIFNLSQNQGLFQLSQFSASGGQSTSNSLIHPSMLASFPLLPHAHILPVFPGIFSQRSHLPQILVSGPSLGYSVQGVIPLPHFLAMHSGTGQVGVSLFFLTKVVAKNSKQSNIYFKEQGKNAEVFQTADSLSSELLIGRLPSGNKWYRLWPLWRWLWIVLYFSSHFFFNLLPLQ